MVTTCTGVNVSLAFFSCLSDLKYTRVSLRVCALWSSNPRSLKFISGLTGGGEGGGGVPCGRMTRIDVSAVKAEITLRWDSSNRCVRVCVRRVCSLLYNNPKEEAITDMIMMTHTVN